MMENRIIYKQEAIPLFDPNAVAVQYIYIEYDQTYSEAEIVPELIADILEEIPKGIDLRLYLDPDGEGDFMEVLSDGEWLSLGISFEQGEEGCFYSYNSAYAGTAQEVEKFQYSDRNVWTRLESGGQSPIPKLQAITDMEAGVKAVEYFIRTGKRYPGIDWLHVF